MGETAGPHLLEGESARLARASALRLRTGFGRTPVPSASRGSRELPWLSKVLWALGGKQILFRFHPWPAARGARA